MKMKLLLVALLATLNLSAITVGEIPKNITIEGQNGGNVTDDSIWSSSSIKDNVYVLFYVDPDEKDTNEHFIQALKKKDYRSVGAFCSMAIINLAATWKPNFIIESILKSKQEEFPKTIYVKDKNSILVNEWEVGDNAANVLVFDKKGKLLFYKSGKMSDEDMAEAFSLIEANL